MLTIFDHWLARIESREMTYGQVRQACEAIFGDGGRRTNLTEEQKGALCELFDKVFLFEQGFALVGLRHGVGWQAAANEWMARNGRRLAMPLDARELSDHMIECAEAGTLTFRWVEVEDIGRRHRSHCLPVYRAYTPDTDETFDYYAIPWQARGYG